MKNSKKIKIVTVLPALIFPSFVFAANDFISLLDVAESLVLQILIPLAYALCLFYFFWGVAKYMRQGAASESAAKEGKRVMVWGIVALFVVTCVWGIVIFIRNEIGIPDIPNAERPTIESVYSNFNPI